MGLKEEEILLNSFYYSNFDYCSLVWSFCLAKSLNKIKKMQERAPRIFLKTFSGDYESISNKSCKSIVEVKRLRSLALEIFKTLNNMNIECMKEMIHKTVFSSHRPLNLEVNKDHKLNVEINV